MREHTVCRSPDRFRAISVMMESSRWVNVVLISCLIAGCAPFSHPVPLDSSVLRDEAFSLIPDMWGRSSIDSERQPRAVIAFQRSFGYNTYQAYIKINQYSDFGETQNGFDGLWRGIQNIKWLNGMYVPVSWSPELHYTQRYEVGCGQLYRGDGVIFDSCTYIGLYGYCVIQFTSQIQEQLFMTYAMFEQIVSSNVDPIGNTNGCLFVSTPTPILSSTAVP